MLEQAAVEEHVEELGGVAQHRRLLPRARVQQQAQVVAVHVHLAPQARVRHEELGVVPRDEAVRRELLLLLEHAQLRLERLAQLLARVVVPDQVRAVVVLRDLEKQHRPVLVRARPRHLLCPQLRRLALRERRLSPLLQK